MRYNVTQILNQRQKLVTNLTQLPDMGQPQGSLDANFILVPVLGAHTKQPSNERAHKVYQFMAQELKVVVRFRGYDPNCEGCLRITVGSPEENENLVKCLNEALIKFNDV